MDALLPQSIQGKLEQTAPPTSAHTSATPGNANGDGPAGRVSEPGSRETSQLADLYTAGRFAELESLARAITCRDPGHGLAWKVLGVALVQQGREAEALPPMIESAKLLPGDCELQNNLGIVFRRQGRYPDAESCFRRVLLTTPESADAHLNLGETLLHQGRHVEAEASFRRAIKLSPDVAEAHQILGVALLNQRRLAEATASFKQALVLKPDFLEAIINLGGVLAGQARLTEAESIFRSGLEVDPLNATLHNSLGIVLKFQNRYLEAETFCRRALHLNPQYAKAYAHLGIIVADLGRQDEAEASLRRALAIEPDSPDVYSSLLFTLNYHPDRGADEIFKDYREYDARFAFPLRNNWRAHGNDGNPERRLRVAYVSPDFRRHSCRSFLQPLLANHDKNQVELYAYAALTVEDEVTACYRRYTDNWISTNGMSDEAIAKRIRDDRIDVLVDLAGHTANNSLAVFARKPAPVSVSWLGFGYTTGLSAIDYYLTDATCAPAGSEELFAERPWRLAACGFVYQPSPEMGEIGALPAVTCGFITFGTLTRSIRINHRTIRVWAELLKAVAGSRLVVDSESFQYVPEQEQLAARFAEHGISRDRLEIGYHTPPWDVLRRIDIGLDCFPHNSGTTLFESLHMGVPFITLKGRPSVGRLGSSILQALGRSEWIAESEAEYISKASALARDTNGLAAVRKGLRDEMKGSPLCDEPGFARRVEAAYREMFRRWCETKA